MLYLSTFTFHTVAAQNTLTKLKAACFSRFEIFKTSVNSRTLNIPAKEIKLVNPKGNQYPEYSLEGLMLKL